MRSSSACIEATAFLWLRQRLNARQAIDQPSWHDEMVILLGALLARA